MYNSRGGSQESINRPPTSDRDWNNFLGPGSFWSAQQPRVPSQYTVPFTSQVQTPFKPGFYLNNKTLIPTPTPMTPGISYGGFGCVYKC